MSEARDYKVIGTRVVRPDGVDKVTGRANFGADFTLPGMLYGKVLRSPHAHARIKKIDTTEAAKIEGVYAIATGADFPKVGHEEITGGEGAGDFADLATNVMARDKVVYHGHAVAAVAAKSSAIADAALAAIKVDYESAAPVMDLDTAMADNATLIDERLFTAGLPEKTNEAEQRRGIHGIQARRHRARLRRSGRGRRRHLPDANRASGLHRTARVCGVDQSGRTGDHLVLHAGSLRRALDDVESARHERGRHSRDSKRNRRRIRRQDDDLSRAGGDGAVEEIRSSGEDDDDPRRSIPRVGSGIRNEVHHQDRREERRHLHRDVGVARVRGGRLQGLVDGARRHVRVRAVRRAALPDSGLRRAGQQAESRGVSRARRTAVDVSRAKA